jgi:hypothetical protein
MGVTAMRKGLALLGLAVPLAGCAGFDWLWASEAKSEPLYCYRYLSDVQCFKTPKHGDERRLVSYQGPAPETYPKPLPPPDPVLAAPPAVGFYVRDPEPIPESPPRLDKVRSVSDPTLPPSGTAQGRPDLGGPPPMRPAPRKPVTPEKY